MQRRQILKSNFEAMIFIAFKKTKPYYTEAMIHYVKAKLHETLKSLLDTQLKYQEDWC